MSNTTKTELETYYSVVNDFAINRTDQDISNGKPDHAVYLISKLFEVANDKVRLYSDHLTHFVTDKKTGIKTDIYGANLVVAQLKSFLKKEGNKLDIVVENEINKIAEHPLVVAIDELKNNNELVGTVEIKQVQPVAIKWLEDNKFTNHFMVSDDLANRVELDDNPDDYKAIANFNNAKKSKELINLFDNMHWKYATTVREW